MAGLATVGKSQTDTVEEPRTCDSRGRDDMAIEKFNEAANGHMHGN